MSGKSILGDTPMASRYSLIEDDSDKPKKKADSGSRAKPPQPKSKRDYRINLALTRELGEALKDEAEAQGRSVNNLVENIIKGYLNSLDR